MEQTQRIMQTTTGANAHRYCTFKSFRKVMASSKETRQNPSAVFQRSKSGNNGHTWKGGGEVRDEKVRKKGRKEGRDVGTAEDG